jgi:general secretion pathway protein J
MKKTTPFIFSILFWMRKRSSDRSGFTMIEILIAIFIFAIIITTVFGSYRATSQQIEIVSKNRYLVEMGRNCIDRMTRDLIAIWVVQPPEYTPPRFSHEPDPYRIVGEEDLIGDQTFARLRFTSLAHLPIRPSRPFGIARIVYYVQSDDNGMHRLFRSDRLFPYGAFEADPMDPILCTDVRSLSFTFYDRTGVSHESWDSESKLVRFSTPVAIGIRLELGDASDIQIFKTQVTLPARRDNIPND